MPGPGSAPGPPGAITPITARLRKTTPIHESPSITAGRRALILADLSLRLRSGHRGPSRHDSERLLDIHAGHRVPERAFMPLGFYCQVPAPGSGASRSAGPIRGAAVEPERPGLYRSVRSGSAEAQGSGP